MVGGSLGGSKPWRDGCHVAPDQGARVCKGCNDTKGSNATKGFFGDALDRPHSPPLGSHGQGYGAVWAVWA